MKRHILTVIVGIVLLVIFALLLFVFQVRVTEVAMVTTFGKPTRPITEPGVYLKWPWPIQKVTKLDKRIQNFESKFEETLTADARNLLIMVYAGWKISDPELFYNRFGGSVAEAERSLEGLIRSAQGQTVGQHRFGDFISTDPKAMKFVEIEKQMHAAVQPLAGAYGIEVRFLGIKKLQLPESITQKVFDRMKAERNKEAEKLLAEGDERATRIRSNADLESAGILAQAEAEATRIQGEGEAEAAQYFSAFEQNPPLAIFLQSLVAFELIAKDRASFILDDRTPPFHLLKGMSIGLPMLSTSPATTSIKTNAITPPQPVSKKTIP